jgi:tetratricopeptide (TPR) repeat protein
MEQTLSVGSFADLEPRRSEKADKRDKAEKPGKAEKAEKADEPRARPASVRPPPKKSSPSSSDISVDDHEFFSEGDLAVHTAPEHHPDEALTIADKAKLRAAPDVVERRARFVRYTKWAVGGAALVCLAALGRAAFSHPESPAPPPARSAIVAEPVAAPKPPEPVETTVAPTPAPEPAASASIEPVPSAAPLAAAPSSSAPAEVGEGSSLSAVEEKKNARHLLERRKLDDAVAAGERSVALDPTDGEAWLILGAAYQEKGNLTDARRAYAACLKEGKTGPRTECAKMLR